MTPLAADGLARGLEEAVDRMQIAPCGGGLIWVRCPWLHSAVVHIAFHARQPLYSSDAGKLAVHLFEHALVHDFEAMLRRPGPAGDGPIVGAVMDACTGVELISITVRLLPPQVGRALARIDAWLLDARCPSLDREAERAILELEELEHTEHQSFEQVLERRLWRELRLGPSLATGEEALAELGRRFWAATEVSVVVAAGEGPIAPFDDGGFRGRGTAYADAVDGAVEEAVEEAAGPVTEAAAAARAGLVLGELGLALWPITVRGVDGELALDVLALASSLAEDPACGPVFALDYGARWFLARRQTRGAAGIAPVIRAIADRPGLIEQAREVLAVQLCGALADADAIARLTSQAARKHGAPAALRTYCERLPSLDRGAVLAQAQGLLGEERPA